MGDELFKNVSGNNTMTAWDDTQLMRILLNIQ